MAISITDILGGNLLDGISKIISQFKLSPEDKANLQLQLQQNADAVKAAEEEYNAKLNDIAGQNIRTEEQSGDKYTERARPSVIWVGLAMYCWNYCIVPTLGIHWHVPSLPIPDTFSEIWGVVTTGYVFARSTDKIMGMSGDSSIKLGPIQISQKSNP